MHDEYMNSNETPEDSFYGYFTTDDHLTGDQSEYAAQKDFEEAAATRHIVPYTARNSRPEHVNKPYVMPTAPERLFADGDIVSTREGAATVVGATFVYTTIQWAYKVEARGRQWHVLESGINGKVEA